MSAPAPSAERFWAERRIGPVLIVGLGPRTGLAAAKLFESQGIPYRISDAATRAELAPLLAELRVAEADVFTGPQDPSQLAGIRRVLLSPGVPRTVPLVREAIARGIPVEVDIDFAYELYAHKRIVAITGTDGKTTTTTLVGELLRTIGTVAVAGNIGVSVLAKLDEIAAADWLVLEVSSFMLEGVTRFRPDIAAILNVAQDHIDRYRSLEQYAETKLGLVEHCRPDDVLVLNADDPTLSRLAPTHLTVRTVSRRRGADSTYGAGQFQVGGHRFRYADCRLRGKANVDNILVAATVAHEAGVPAAPLAATVSAFPGLRHRFEHLGRFGGVEVYEDSKASNVHAVEAALANFEQNVVLILGGRDKGLDFSVLRAHLPRLRALVCYGEDGERLRDAIGAPDASYTYRFDEAVALAAAACRPGDVLLLSPGCTSWDQFPNYEVRGDVFRELVPQVLGADAAKELA